MEHTESHLKDQTTREDFQPSSLETIPETPENEVEEQAEDPWRVTLAEPVDWAKDLGSAQPTEEEKHHLKKEWESSEAAWAAEPEIINHQAE